MDKQIVSHPKGNGAGKAISIVFLLFLLYKLFANKTADTSKTSDTGETKPVVVTTDTGDTGETKPVVVTTKTVTPLDIITEDMIAQIEASIARGEQIYSLAFLANAKIALAYKTSVSAVLAAQAYGIPLSQMSHQMLINRAWWMFMQMRYASHGEDVATSDVIGGGYGQSKSNYEIYSALIPLFESAGGHLGTPDMAVADVLTILQKLGILPAG